MGGPAEVAELPLPLVAAIDAVGRYPGLFPVVR